MLAMTPSFSASTSTWFSTIRGPEATNTGSVAGFAEVTAGGAALGELLAATTLGRESSQPIAREAMSDTPIIPSKAELPDAAFKKLDAGGKGYVSKEDIRGMSGFDKSFQLADANKDGKLNAAEFRKAWADYTGRANG